MLKPHSDKMTSYEFLLRGCISVVTILTDLFFDGIRLIAAFQAANVKQIDNLFLMGFDSV